MQANTQPHTHTRTHARTHTHTHTHTHTGKQTNKQTHTLTHARTHARTHTGSLSHTHPNSRPPFTRSFPVSLLPFYTPSSSSLFILPPSLPHSLLFRIISSSPLFRVMQVRSTIRRKVNRWQDSRSVSTSNTRASKATNLEQLALARLSVNQHTAPLMAVNSKLPKDFAKNSNENGNRHTEMPMLNGR